MDGAQWSQDLPGRPRGRPTPRDSHERHGGRRSLDHPSRFLEDEGRSGYHQSSQRGIPKRRSKEHDISLEDGVQDLFHSVNEAIDLLSHLDRGFQQDVQRIRVYCDERLINAIWMEKVRGIPRETRDGRIGRHRGGHDEEIETGEQRQSTSLRSTIKQLLSTIEIALDAAHHFRASQRRSSRYKPDDVAKIGQQLTRTYENLRKSFPVVMQRSSEMGHITTELEMLGVFLGRNVPRNTMEGGPRDGGHPGARRRADDSDFGGQGAYGNELDEPAEEWSGGQDAEQGADEVAGGWN
ncbi:MAG: hypothetical protein Q9209_005951 [Squamulea sp. 1 TL-2023]